MLSNIFKKKSKLQVAFNNQCKTSNNAQLCEKVASAFLEFPTFEIVFLFI